LVDNVKETGGESKSNGEIHVFKQVLELGILQLVDVNDLNIDKKKKKKIY